MKIKIFLDEKEIEDASFLKIESILHTGVLTGELVHNFTKYLGSVYRIDVKENTVYIYFKTITC